MAGPDSPESTDSSLVSSGGSDLSEPGPEDLRYEEPLETAETLETRKSLNGAEPAREILEEFQLRVLASMPLGEEIDPDPETRAETILNIAAEGVAEKYGLAAADVRTTVKEFIAEQQSSRDTGTNPE